jgi:hypothetical protein
MVILLDGTSKMGRIAIAEQLVEKNQAWKHLALEVIEGATPPDQDEDFHAQVVKRCAEELGRDNLHLMLTLPGESEQFAMLSRALKPNVVTVHLGKDGEGDYDYVIDPNAKSVKDVVKFLETIMQEI